MKEDDKNIHLLFLQKLIIKSYKTYYKMFYLTKMYGIMNYVKSRKGEVFK